MYVLETARLNHHTVTMPQSILPNCLDVLMLFLTHKERLSSIKNGQHQRRNKALKKKTLKAEALSFSAQSLVSLCSSFRLWIEVWPKVCN